MAEIIEISKEIEEEVNAELNAEAEAEEPKAPQLIPFETIMHGGYKLSAIEKLRAEAENFNAQNPKAKAIKEELTKALVGFCDESELVSEVIFRTARTLGDCCDFIIEEVEKRYKESNRFSGFFGGVLALSDTEVYTMALRFYFPESEVKAVLTVKLGNKPSEEEMNKPYERPEPPKKAPAKKAEKKKAAKKKTSDDQQAIEGFDAIPENEGTEKEPENEKPVVPQYTEKCADCGTGISDRCVEWSLANFGKHLCPKCQKEHSRKKSEEQFVQLSLI